MSHVIYEWVLSHIWMGHVTSTSHVTRKWVMSHIQIRRITSTSHMTYEWVMSHILMSHVTCMSHVTYEFVTLHISMRRVTSVSHMTYEWVMWHMNEWGHMNESCWHVNEAGHTCQPCMSHPRVMPRMNESECTYQSVISRASTIRTLRMVPSSFSSFSFESPSYSRYFWEFLVYRECRISDLRLLLHHQS